MRQLLVVVFFLGVCSAKGQMKFSMGEKAGLNLSKFSYTNNPNELEQSYLAGWHAGIYGLFRYQKFGIQVETLYSRLGSKDAAKYSVFGNSTKLDYISVPILFKWYFPLGFNVQAGPQLAFAVRRVTEASTNPTAYYSADAKFRTADFSAALGVGWESSFGLSVDARYYLGLMNMGQGLQPQTNSRVIQFSAGYRIFKPGK